MLKLFSQHTYVVHEGPDSGQMWEWAEREHLKVISVSLKLT